MQNRRRAELQRGSGAAQSVNVFLVGGSVQDDAPSSDSLAPRFDGRAIDCKRRNDAECALGSPEAEHYGTMQVCAVPLGLK